MKSAERIEGLLTNKPSFGELWNQKGGECATPCDKQLCSFPTLSEQESSQTRQMDRGEIEIEEERASKNGTRARPPEKHEKRKRARGESQPVHDR